MASDLRTDPSHNISYPQAPDTRGTARIYHLRKPYYLGSHDSPLSYVMFGLWKHHLLERGEALPTATIREQAEAALGIVPTSKKRMLTIGLMVSALALTWLFGAVVGVTFRSTPTVQLVDGLTLSASEMEFIRGVRKQNERIAVGVNEEVLRTSFETAALIEGQVNRDEILKRIRGN